MQEAYSYAWQRRSGWLEVRDSEFLMDPRRKDMGWVGSQE